MPIQPCPKCQTPTPRQLSGIEGALVNYYRCDQCGHVWNLPKSDPNAPPKPVTL